MLQMNCPLLEQNLPVAAELIGGWSHLPITGAGLYIANSEHAGEGKAHTNHYVLHITH